MADDYTERYGQLVPSTHNRMVGERYDESRALDRDAQCPSGDFLDRLERLADFGLRGWKRL